MKTKDYLPQIDGLRAIAVLSVILYHFDSNYLPGGFAGVDVFFVISGYVVTLSMMKLPHSGLIEFLLEFYSRRVRRILPALLLCVLITSFFVALLIPETWLSNTTNKTGIYAIFGFSNIVLERQDHYFSPRTDYNPFTHTWSLGVEEQFYLIFPLIYFLAWRLFPKRTEIFKALICFISLTIAVVYFVQDRNASSFYFLHTRLWELICGSILYGVTHNRMIGNSVLNQILSLSSLILLFFSIIFSSPQLFPFPGALGAVLGTVGVIYFSTNMEPENKIKKILSMPFLVKIGQYSYSLYLWHWPVLAIFRWTLGLDSVVKKIVAALIIFCLSHLSFVMIENKLRHFRFQNSRRNKLIIMFASSVVLFVTYSTVKKFHKYKSNISLSAIDKNHDLWYPNISQNFSKTCRLIHSRSSEPFASVETYKTNCTNPKSPKVYAVGDSHLVAYTTMLSELVARTNIEVQTFYPNCPFIKITNPSTVDCKSKERSLRDHLLSKIKSGDILFLPGLRLPRFKDQWLAFTEKQFNDALHSQSAIDQRKQGLAEAFESLKLFEAMGVNIILEAPKPVFKSPSFRCFDSYFKYNDFCKEGLTISRREVEEIRSPVMESYRKIHAHIKGVRTWDPLPVLCGEHECKAVDDAKPIFHDGDHLSHYGNTLLFDSFSGFIQNVAKIE